MSPVLRAGADFCISPTLPRRPRTPEEGGKFAGPYFLEGFEKSDAIRGMGS